MLPIGTSAVDDTVGSREEIMVDFGLSNIRRTGQPQISIKVSRRFPTPPNAGGDGEAISQYEARFGTIEIGTGPKAPDPSASADDLQKPN